MRHSASRSGDRVGETLDGDGDGHRHPMPVGGPLKRKGAFNFYSAFEYEGHSYKLKDTVVVAPSFPLEEKPYVAIIKDIFENLEGELKVHGQWFYRPEELKEQKIKLDDDWDNREVYHSLHFDDMYACSILHKCTVYHVPSGDKVPDRFQHPGLYVRQFFDHVNSKCLELTDKNIKDEEQREIRLLIEKTQERLKGRHFNLEMTRIQVDNPLEDTKVDEHECEIILTEKKAWTGDKMRDVALKKLFQAILSTKKKILEKNNFSVDVEGASNLAEETSELDDVLLAVCSLERHVYKSFQAPSKYNQRMRHLAFNLKKYDLLAERFLSKELEAEDLLNMRPEELKDGYVAPAKPEEPHRFSHIQMTEARCSRCSKKSVAVRDLIGGPIKLRYLVECLICGNTWYSSPGAQ